MKDARLAVRLSDVQLEQIRQAANTTGQSLSDFTVRTLTADARHVLADRRTFRLDEDSWERLNALMDRPVQHKPRLAALMSSASPFSAPPAPAE